MTESDHHFIPCFRQTRKKHQSGFRIIETGYEVDGRFVANTAAADCLHFNVFSPQYDFAVSIDLCPGGYYRILPHDIDRGLKWERDAYSDTELQTGWEDAGYIRSLMERNE